MTSLQVVDDASRADGGETEDADDEEGGGGVRGDEAPEGTPPCRPVPSPPSSMRGDAWPSWTPRSESTEPHAPSPRDPTLRAHGTPPPEPMGPHLQVRGDEGPSWLLRTKAAEALDKVALS